MDRPHLRPHLTHLIKVIGIGNILMKDEGFGPAVIEELKEIQMPDDVELIDGGTSGLGLFEYLKETNYAIIIDCVDFKGKAGEFIKFKPEDVNIHNNNLRLSLHECNLVDVLNLTKALGIECDVTIFGVQPHEIKPEIGLSDILRGLVPKIAGEVLAQIRRIRECQVQRS